MARADLSPGVGPYTTNPSALRPASEREDDLGSPDNTANHKRLDTQSFHTFNLKHTDLQVEQAMVAALFGNRILVVVDARPRAIAVRTTPEYAKQIEELVERFDRGPEIKEKNVEITVYLLVGSDSVGEQLSPSLRKTLEPTGAPLPAERYRLLDTLIERTRTGRPSASMTYQSSVTGLAPLGQVGSRKSLYSLAMEVPEVFSEGAREMIDLRLRIGGRIPVGLEPAKEGQPEKIAYEPTGMSVFFDLPEGEPVIAGQAPLFESGIPMLVLLLAKFIR